MNANNTVARWAMLWRGAAYVVVAAAVWLSYLAWKPASAQEKTAKTAAVAAPAGKPAEKAAPEAGPSANLSPEQAAKLAEAALAAGDQTKKDAKAAAEAEEKPGLNLIQIVRDGGAHMWAVYAILAVSVVAVAFAIERLLGLRRRRVLPPEFMAGLKAITGQKNGFDPRQASRLCRQYPSSAATVVRAVLQKIGRPMPEIEHAAEAASEREASRLYANVRWQNLAFNLAPMLGLAGTVHGMIIAFFTTATMPLGANKMSQLATGIYAALICTLAGLVVAIPAGVLAHVLEGRILKMLRELEDVLLALLPHLERYEGRQRGGKAAAAPAEPLAAELAQSEADDPKSKWPVINPATPS
jgi:biopolymer transport protein ExbB